MAERTGRRLTAAELRRGKVEVSADDRLRLCYAADGVYWVTGVTYEGLDPIDVRRPFGVLKWAREFMNDPLAYRTRTR